MLQFAPRRPREHRQPARAQERDIVAIALSDEVVQDRVGEARRGDVATPPPARGGDVRVGVDLRTRPVSVR